MMSVLELLGPYVPLFQTVAWMLFTAVLLFAFRNQAKSLLWAIHGRIEKGSPLKAGPIEIGQDLSALAYVQKDETRINAKPVSVNGRSPAEWSALRNDLYQNHRNIFLAHVIQPAGGPGRQFDVYIYLVRHQSQNFSDVEYAEFFFGRHWGNQVIQRRERNGLIGVATSASGPFLCTCRVVFQDGAKIDLYRYVDFEMSRVFERES